MDDLSSRSIGETLAQAARLPGRAVAVYGSEEPPDGSMPLADVDRCIARAAYRLAMDVQLPPLFYGHGAKAGICGGGQTWCGLARPAPMLKFFVSKGTPNFMGGAAEFLKPDPLAAERFFDAPGKIEPLAQYINLAGCERLAPEADVRSFLFMGPAESIRNLCGLVQFVSDDIFTAVLVPGGPSCASMITYAAGMAERAPADRAFVGPVDPTGNAWLPPDMMSMAVPHGLARTMAQNIGASFLAKRPSVAFPDRRLGLEDRGER